MFRPDEDPADTEPAARAAEETPALSEPRRGESKVPIDEVPVPPLTDEEDTMGG